MPNSLPLARAIGRALPQLRRNIQWLLPLMGVLFVLEAALATLWLRQPPDAVLRAGLAALPGLILLGVALINLRGIATRVAALALLFWANYAQYTFASFFRRFLGTSELQLAAANSVPELIASIGLYFSWMALLAALATTSVYAVATFRRPATETSRLRAAAALVALLAWALLIDDAAVRLPLGAPSLAFVAKEVRWIVELVREREAVHPQRHAAPHPPGPAEDFDVIYLVGESLRADRFAAGAYRRNVAPYLLSVPLPHVAFSNVTSHGDCTGRSVPYLMLAPARPLHLNLYRNPSLFSYAHQAGYRTSFIYANENDWDEFVDDNIEIVRRNAELAPGSDRWTFDNDAAMMETIADIANAPGRQFLVIETYTSHWPYGDRYESCPQCRVFRPDIPHGPAPFSNRLRPKIVNSYDNAIIYFDRFVARLIGALHKPTLIVFTSDHGESLGESGAWGHCSAAIEQMFVPLIFIASDARVARAAGFERLAQVADVPVSHANVFPTLLKYFGYDASVLEFSYPASLDALEHRGETDRAVLTSEIGTGAEPVSFAHIDGARVITRWEEIVPH